MIDRTMVLGIGGAGALAALVCTLCAVSGRYQRDPVYVDIQQSPSQQQQDGPRKTVASMWMWDTHEHKRDHHHHQHSAPRPSAPEPDHGQQDSRDTLWGIPIQQVGPSAPGAPPRGGTVPAPRSHHHHGGAPWAIPIQEAGAPAMQGEENVVEQRAQFMQVAAWGKAGKAPGRVVGSRTKLH